MKEPNSQENVLRRFWQSFVEGKFDMENAIQTEAEFSSAIDVTDKIGVWEEGHWVGSRSAASMWIYWKPWIGCAMMLWMSTCGYRSLPSSVKKPRCWKPCTMTWQIHALSSGECYGSRHQHVSTKDFWTTEWSSRNTMRRWILPLVYIRVECIPSTDDQETM